MSSLKVLIVGDSGVGKSFMLRCFLRENQECVASPCATTSSSPPVMPETIAPTQGVDFETCILLCGVGSAPVKLHIWDASGKDAFRSITECYLKGVHGSLCVFDASSRQSFYSVGAWLGRLKQHAPTAETLLVGRRPASRPRVVAREEGEACALLFSARYAEEEDAGVRAVFEALVQSVQAARREEDNSSDSGGPVLCKPLLDNPEQQPTRVGAPTDSGQCCACCYTCSSCSIS
jgi:small GTP-binding protein